MSGSTPKNVCDICNIYCDNQALLLAHIRSHGENENEQKIYTCNECGRTFTVASNLKRHNMTVHSAVKPYSCELCGKQFNQKSNLKRHQKFNCKSDTSSVSSVNAGGAYGSAGEFDGRSSGSNLNAYADEQSMKIASMISPLNTEFSNDVIVEEPYLEELGRHEEHNQPTGNQKFMNKYQVHHHLHPHSGNHMLKPQSIDMALPISIPMASPVLPEIHIVESPVSSQYPAVSRFAASASGFGRYPTSTSSASSVAGAPAGFFLSSPVASAVTPLAVAAAAGYPVTRNSSELSHSQDFGTAGASGNPEFSFGNSNYYYDLHLSLASPTPNASSFGAATPSALLQQQQQQQQHHLQQPLQQQQQQQQQQPWSTNSQFLPFSTNAGYNLPSVSSSTTGSSGTSSARSSPFYPDFSSPMAMYANSAFSSPISSRMDGFPSGMMMMMMMANANASNDHNEQQQNTEANNGDENFDHLMA